MTVANTASRRMEQRLHANLYFGIQLLRGRPVGPLMRRLRRWETLDAESYRRLSDERLAAMLEYARHKVPFYGRGRWGAALGRRGTLHDWPVIERAVLAEERDQLVVRSPGLPLVTRESSASTGEPVRVAWDPIAMAWSWAAEYYPMSWHGLGVGTRTLKVWGSSHALENWTLNRKFVPADDLSPAQLGAAVRHLKAHRPPLIWGTPSAVAQLARHAGREHGRDADRPVAPYARIDGEQVYAFQREEIGRYLGARTIEAYGCAEMGPIAAECTHGSLHVLTSNVHVEIFRNGEPAPPGEFGDIVATTLVNKGMPLIRCRIGDSGRLSPEPCACGLPQPVLAQLRGRSSDMLHAADGTPVHGSALGQALHRYVGRAPLGQVQQIRFEQIDQRRWRIEVESQRPLDHDALTRQLDELVHETFGKSRVDVRVVRHIPREASGKYRYYRRREPALPAQPGRLDASA